MPAKKSPNAKPLRSKASASINPDNPRNGGGQQAASAKRRIFALHYVRTRNATASAIKAGYSEKTACAQGHVLLKHVEVKRFLQAEYDRQAKDMEVTNDKIILALARIGFADLRKAYDDDGSLIPIHELDDNTAAALSSFEVDEITIGSDVVGVTKKMKFADKKGALELLMRHRGMLNDKLKLSGDADNPLAMFIQEINGQGSALRPVAHDPEAAADKNG